MSVLNEHFYTYEEFEAKRKETDRLLEFIDRVILYVTFSEY